MEQWEKEYLEIVQKRKQTEYVTQGYSEQQKEYLNACWEEVTRPDGSKWYVPRQNVIQKQIRQRQRRFSVAVIVKSVLRIALAVYVLFMFFSGASGYISQNSVNLSSDFSHLKSGILRSIGVRNTMVDGLGLRDMLNALWEIRDSHTETLNMFVGNDHSFSDEEMDAWVEQLDADLVVIGKLPHDDSYSEVLDSYILLLNTLKVYVRHAQGGDWVLAQAAHAEYSALLSELTGILAKAFDQNGVKYTLNENKITYTYFEY